MKKKPKPRPKSKYILMNFKVTKEERSEILKRAKRHRKGKISPWIRYASTHCAIPKAG